MSKVLKISLPFVAGALFAFVMMSSFNLFRPASAQPGYQPNMEQALGNLHAARINLEVSSPDKGGHRVRALELVNQAIYQVRQGIAFAE
jgi:hypothetical protein